MIRGRKPITKRVSYLFISILVAFGFLAPIIEVALPERALAADIDPLAFCANIQHASDRCNYLDITDRKDITKQPTWTAEKEILSTLYMRALLACMKDGGGFQWHDTAQDQYLANYDEWNDAGGGRILRGNYNVGSLIDPTDNGHLNCENEDKGWVQKAFSMWDINDPITAACIIGWYRFDPEKVEAGAQFPASRSSYSDCLKSSTGSVFTTKVSRKNTAANGGVFYSKIELVDETTIMNRLYAARGITIDLSDADKYILYMSTFVASSANDVGCHAVDRGPRSAATPDLEAKVSDNKHMVVTLIEGTGANATPVDHIFELLDGKEESSTVAVAAYLEGRPLYTGQSPASSPSQDGKNACSSIKNVINSFAPAFLTAVKAGDRDSSEASFTPPGAPGETGGGPTTCNVDGLGWMVCPLLNAAGGLNDLMYGLVEWFLLLNPLQTNDPGTGAETPQYIAWQRIRDIANVLLVIVFVLVIFSQITNIGVTNYGIKKILPRIILVAIAINLSFFIMMLAVDLVNIIGKGLHDLLIGLAPDIKSGSIDGTNVGSSWAALVSAIIVGGGITLATFLPIGAGAVAYLLLPFIVVGALSLIAALATLVIRNALIIVLVLIAPIAFAAFLLPNTQSLFDRWRKLLLGMLFLYPTAALLFGGAKFAANIMAVSTEPFTYIVALFVMVAPLGMLPWLAASSGGILATIGNKLQGAAKSAGAPLRNWAGKRGDNARKNYQAGRTNWLGRRRSEADIAARRAQGRRTLGQRRAESDLRRDLDSTNADKQTVENLKDTERRRSIRERARNVAGKGRNAAPNVFDDQRTLGIQESASNALYDRRADQRRAQVGTIENAAAIQEKVSQGYSERSKKRVDNQYKEMVAADAVLSSVVQESKRLDENEKTLDLEQDRIFEIDKNTDPTLMGLGDRQADANRDIEQAKDLEEQRQLLRVRNNDTGRQSGVSLRAQAADMARTKEEIKGSKLNIDREVRDTGALDGAIQEQKGEELKIKAYDDEQQADFDQSVLRDRDADGNAGDLLQAAERIDTAARSKARDEAGLKLRMDRRANQEGTEENQMRQAEEDAEFKSEVIAGENRKDLEERKATTLSAEENKRRADEAAKKTAIDEQQGNYSEEVSTEGSAIQTRASGTINPNEGRIKATAYGLEAQRQLDEANVRAAQVLGGNTSEQAYQGDIRVGDNGELEFDSSDPEVISDILQQSGVIEDGDIVRGPDGTLTDAAVAAWVASNPTTAAGVGLVIDPASGQPRMLTDDRDILTTAGRRARIIGDTDTIDNANPGLIPALSRVQSFTADTTRGGTSTTFGVQATATNLAQGKRLTAQGLMEMFAGLPPLPDRATDPAGWQREIEARSQMVTNINKAAEAAGLPHMSKNRLRPDGSLEVGGEKGGVKGMVTDMLQTNTPITKHMLQDLSDVQDSDGQRVVVGYEIARQFYDIMNDPDKQVQYLRLARSLNAESIEVLASRLSEVSGVSRSTLLDRLRDDSGSAQRDFTT